MEILDYFVDFCKKKSLSYMLIGGTALGAYRHRGFIPWDDDLDVAMPREDYERFLKLHFEFDSEKYVIQNESNEEKWFLTFSKIRRMDTVFIEGYANGLYENNGIYIDVFPLDSLSEKKSRFYRINYLKHCLKFYSCRDLYRRRGKVKYCLEHIICLPIYIFKQRNILQVLNNLCKSHDKQRDDKYYVVYDDAIIQAIPYNVFFPTEELYFEEKKYNAPGNIKEYLKCTYGEDYMVLPPESERKTHEPIKIAY